MGVSWVCPNNKFIAHFISHSVESRPEFDKVGEKVPKSGFFGGVLSGRRVTGRW